MQSDYWQAPKKWNGKLPLGEAKDIRKIARAITLAEYGLSEDENTFKYNGSLLQLINLRLIRFCMED